MRTHLGLRDSLAPFVRVEELCSVLVPPHQGCGVCLGHLLAWCNEVGEELIVSSCINSEDGQGVENVEVNAVLQSK